MKPSAPGEAASTKVSGEVHMASPVVLITWFSVTPRPFIRAGSTRTCNCRSRWPQSTTLATPGTASSRGRIRQRASVDRSVGDIVAEDSATAVARACTDSGWTITGGVPTATSAGPWDTRSVSSWRAL